MKTNLRRLPPPAFLAMLYSGLIAIGTVLLSLPVAQYEPVGWVESMFTSTSAVTVTGLIVVDTGSAYTPFGQVVIAILMQLGGLGLMAFAVLVLTTLGIPIGIPQQMILREDLNQTSLANLTTLVGIIFRMALICEAAGTAILSLVFVPEFGWSQGIWLALFHTISAFNNAGFSLFPDSLMRWVDDPIINITVPSMFILSGLGFVVIGDIIEKRRWNPLTLHTKLMLVGTVALILLSWSLFAALEWSNPATLGALDGFWARLQASWFQAVTPRTAGFNTIDTAGMHDSTALMTISLMLIGGGSTSTAGGIKVTTFIVLLIATAAFFRRRQHLHAFGRSLGVNEVMKVMALTTVSMLIVFAGIFLLTLSTDGNFLHLAFEVASAFGTVGLSMGATATLDDLGMGTIMLIMFLGRVGPLALGFFLATRSMPRVRYPAGQIYLG